MNIVADLHLHSKYSRAVSPQMNLREMARWAKIKGIDLLGTGDFTHPKWLEEIKDNLEEKEGVLELRDKRNKKDQKDKKETKFLLTTEISSIYNQGGKTRKIHNLIIAPSVAVVEKINTELKKRGGNLSSDGRPIVGLSAKQVAELVFSVDKNCLLIPCHIWTPWFSLFGANSGFDSVEECFGEFSKYIYAVETGLSSDPEMNWSVFDLDDRNIVSFSDAHSASKLGREATVLEMGDIKILRYEDIRRGIVGKWEDRSEKLEKEVGSENSENQIISLRNPASHFLPHISHTLEFYPEEGKYHYTGHRNCGVVFSPEETLKKGTTCPVCGKELTIGVTERVRKLGVLGRLGKLRAEETIDEVGVKWIKGRTEGPEGKERTPFIKIVPLKEIISETLKLGESSRKVEELYFKLIKDLGNEIEILTKMDLGVIGKIGGEKLAEGIKKVRNGNIFIRPGYDGEFGVVKIWEDEGSRGDKRIKGNEGDDSKEQMCLF